MGLDEQVPAIVTLGVVANTVAILVFSGMWEDPFHRAQGSWLPYLARTYVLSIATLVGMTFWVSFIAGIVRIKGVH